MALSSLGRVTLFSNGLVKELGGFDATDADERFRFQAFNIQSLQLLQVQKFEADLIKLHSGYSKVLQTMCAGDTRADTFTIKESGPYYMNQMITLYVGQSPIGHSC